MKIETTPDRVELTTEDLTRAVEEYVQKHLQRQISTILIVKDGRTANYAASCELRPKLVLKKPVRASKTFYLSPRRSWDNAAATAAASVEDGPVLGDMVVQYSTSTGFCQSSVWNGSWDRIIESFIWVGGQPFINTNHGTGVITATKAVNQEIENSRKEIK